MTKDPARIAAIGLIAFLLALVSLGTGSTARRHDGSAIAELSTPNAEKEERVSSRVFRALRRGERIDINNASVADLQLLPGIGPKLAERIIADRKKNGSFREVTDLTRVSGIGPVTLTRIERLVTINDH